MFKAMFTGISEKYGVGPPGDLTWLSWMMGNHQFSHEKKGAQPAVIFPSTNPLMKWIFTVLQWDLLDFNGISSEIPKVDVL